MADSQENAALLFPEQLAEVRQIILKDNVFSEEVTTKELDLFYTKLGLPLDYFRTHTPETIAKHIQSLQAERVLAKNAGHPLDINLHQEDETSAMFATRSFVKSRLGQRVDVSPEMAASIVKLETHIENKYLSGAQQTQPDASGNPTASVHPDSLSYQPSSKKAPVFRLQAFRSRGVLDEDVHLRLYLLAAPDFANPKPAEGETDIQQLGDKTFLKTTDPAVLASYQKVLSRVTQSLGPAVDVVQQANGEILLLVAHHIGTTHSYFTGIPDVYRYFYFYATEKFVEPFSNNVVIFAFFLKNLEAIVDASGKTTRAPSEPLETRLAHVAAGISLHFVLPRTSLTPLLRLGRLSADQVAYGYAAWKFAYHFLSRNTREFAELSTAFQGNSEALGLLSKLRIALKSQSFTEGSILESINSNAAAVAYMYEDFAARHMVNNQGRAARSDAEMSSWIRRNCSTDMDRIIFTSFATFNKHILKTNFYKPGKIALAFRLDPAFLSQDYKEKPFGVFFVLGSEFRGFHVRFHDVARGGIRLVRSRFSQDYAQNLASIFDECYNLSNTQQRKNKDIPEGGSKGIILLHFAHQDKGTVAFEKFVDSLLDLMLPHEAIVDLYGKREILFLGPDEGTADLMDWASLHSRKRGYEYWKAFTTGKSVIYGGIPHDLFGMTTQGVRAYVTGIQRKLGIDAASSFKVQTGGPDGDLGSNEIKQSKEKTMAVVDGSGVLFDPEGIDGPTLLGLAEGRKMVQHFDRSKLSPKGFLVLIDEKDIKLPDGTVVESGLSFRNSFHFSSLLQAEFFVPCGGRPAAVDGSNVKEFLYGTDSPQDGTKKPRFKYVVEGANLFFTQDARLVLEKAGLIVFKDASANKGGVTSSSLEVLAALCLTNEEFESMMVVRDIKSPPAVYSEYVREVQDTIARNADLEFDCLWRENQATKMPISVLSDKLSVKITDLSAAIEKSESLWNNLTFRQKVLARAVPQVLQKHVGLETVVKRIPENYARALFASHIASRFIYEYGLETPEFAFYEWVEKFISA